MSITRTLALFALSFTTSCSFFVAPPPAAAPPEVLELPGTAGADPRVELLWDTYGVPHMFAEDPAALFYAHGWAQARSHADLLLRLYGQSRGRAAEYWGAAFVESDTWVLTNDIPQRAEEWLAVQKPHARAYIDAFVAGINAYATMHADSIGATYRQVLPVRAEDVLAHQQRVLNFTFMANAQVAAGLQRQLQAGSNAWAIGPMRSENRTSMLLMNPHLPWGDLFTWYEVHMSAPGFNAYGATLVGFPIPAMAFNEHLGWALTVNTIDTWDLYSLTPQPAGDGTPGYLFDGVVRPFEARTHTLRVRMPDNSVEERPLTVQHSVHGPVIAQGNGRAIALRVAGLDAAHLVEQGFDMIRATDQLEFENALARLQLPMFTVMYADRVGNILHVSNGTVPVRSSGDWAYWQGVVSGDSSGTLWTRSHDYHQLPRITNPTSGWLQNANDPPWTTTLPSAIEPVFYPPYMAPQRPLGFRPQRSMRMLHEDTRITFDELLTYKHSTRMEAADHLVQDVVTAARATGDADARAAADLLEQWDRTADADSRGAVLFVEFLEALQRHRWPTGSPFDIAWTPRAPLATPDGLADPSTVAVLLGQAARDVRTEWGVLDVPWGDVHRLRRDSLDLPGNGGPGAAGIFRVVDYDVIPGDSVRGVATGGDSFVAAVEFSTPIRARTLLTYGNASQPGSPHRTDQLPLFAAKELKPALFTREDLLPHVRLREVF